MELLVEMFAWAARFSLGATGALAGLVIGSRGAYKFYEGTPTDNQKLVLGTVGMVLGLVVGVFVWDHGLECVTRRIFSL